MLSTSDLRLSVHFPPFHRKRHIRMSGKERRTSAQNVRGVPENLRSQGGGLRNRNQRGLVLTLDFAGRTWSFENVRPQIPQLHCTCGTATALADRCVCHTLDSSPLHEGQVIGEDDCCS